MKQSEELRAQADKLWFYAISRLTYSCFQKPGLTKVQALYDEADRLEAQGK